MGLMCLLAVHLLQCQSNLCLHPRSGLLLSCSYLAILWLRQLLWVGRRQVVFAPSILCVWSRRPWRSQQIILLPVGFLHIHLQEFNGSSKFVTLWIYSYGSHFGSSKVCSQFWVLCGYVVEHCISWTLWM